MARKKKKGKRQWTLGSSEDVPTAELVEVHRELQSLRVEGFLHDHRRRAKGQRRVRSTRDDPSGLIEWAQTRAEKLEAVRGKTT